MKKVIVSFVLLSILFFTSCEVKRGDGDGSAAKVGEENTLVWAVTDNARIKEEYVQKTNQLLSQKGYNLAIEIRYLKTDKDDEKPEVYHDALAEAVKAGEVDIAYCDLWYGNAPGEMSLYLQSGLFDSLTEWLHSPDGAPVYDLYDEDVWKGSSVGGENYILPDENCFSSLVGVISFRQDYVSEKLINSWDGSWSDLWRIMEQIKLPKGDYMLLGSPWLEFFEGKTDKKKYEVDDKLIYNIQSGKVQQPFELEEFHEYLSFLHQCFQKGYFTQEDGMDSGSWDMQKEQCLAKGRYAIAFQIDGGLDDISPESSFAITGALGGGTAVSAYSKKKEKALELLKILRTDDEIANTLVWGEGDESELLGEDGYVKKFRSDASDRCIFGLNDGILQCEEDVPEELNMREYRKKCENSPLRTSSKLLGFWPDYSGIEGELEAYQEELTECMDCWQEKDFERAYRKAEKRVRKVSGKLLKELNNQIKEWK